VTGYITPAARYCAITGGRYSVTAASGTADEKGTCTLPGGRTCDAAAWYGATCNR
jgi:putative hemolysin